MFSAVRKHKVHTDSIILILLKKRWLKMAIIKDLSWSYNVDALKSDIENGNFENTGDILKSNKQFVSSFSSLVSLPVKISNVEKKLSTLQKFTSEKVCEIFDIEKNVMLEAKNAVELFLSELTGKSRADILEFINTKATVTKKISQYLSILNTFEKEGEEMEKMEKMEVKEKDFTNIKLLKNIFNGFSVTKKKALYADMFSAEIAIKAKKAKKIKAVPPLKEKVTA
jgi:hypothetical protein